MFDGADARYDGKGDKPGGENIERARDHHAGLRACLRKALVVARVFLFVVLVPFQSGIWLAAWLGSVAPSRPVVVVASALVATGLSFIGLIGVLKLEAAGRRRI